ncbi:MAG: trypsin-like peptidase domain-containing protein [Chloroflexia bacterium]|nr:trypsin-like peptidase domain-containing protein [Chloroflexia bacterium]MDQ3515007.1 trypsin-like peptidase domain-containing protein [Chloroflexota bacterium]
MRRFLYIVAIVVVLSCFGLATVAYVIGTSLSPDEEVAQSPGNRRPVVTRPADDARAVDLGIQTGSLPPGSDPVAVVRRVGPAVVTVLNERESDGSFSPGGTGTGFIISTSGDIVTNEHVVAGGDRFSVILQDGQERTADLVGSDPIADLAVLRMEGDVPGIVSLGDSDALLPGQRVLAIGSPLGSFTNTVTRGIIGAVERDFPGAGTYADLVQHDAAINPGNSGGPLVTLSGEVVGVNTLGVPRTEDGQLTQGLFFAVPSNHVSSVVTALIDDGRVVYPFLGVGYVVVDGRVAAEADLSVSMGALVTRVLPGGPAEGAGLREGDVILSIGDQDIGGRTTFFEALEPFVPGDVVDISVRRGDETFEAEVDLVERPADA